MPSPEACPKCGAELPAHAPHGLCPKCSFLAAVFPAQPGTLHIEPLAEEPLERIGRYKILQKIGEGGCGAVYVADQDEPVRRRVALKVIKLGMDTRQVIARFEAERQALALMDHPNIAKVLDAGATETGRPYFIMELVKGIPITRYCDENKLDTQKRLGLFIQVCKAIQHAHQKGIIHRDIKPSNILVADHDGMAVPKIIDFGIAKATTDQRLTDKTIYTAVEQFIGTPAYMSPEQANLSGLDIDTRSDIYSLGVLLYELLTGRTPFDAKRLIEAGLDEIRRIIREEDPPRPSTKLGTLEASAQTTVAKQRSSEPPRLLGLIRGDLDWIVMKTLEKDRKFRYDTASGLALDIQRHLDNEPVSAVAPSAVYRVRKLVSRHRAALAAVSAFVLLLLVAVIVSTWLAVRATHAELVQRQLRQQADQARAEETAAKDRVQEKSRQLAETLSQLEQQKIDEVTTKESSSKALAFLAGTLRRNPDNYRAAYRLLSLLSHRNVARLKSERQFEGQVRATCYGLLGPLVLTTTGGGDVWLWDYRKQQQLAGPLEHNTPIAGAEFTPSGRSFLVTLTNGAVEVWNVTNTARPSGWFRPADARTVVARAFNSDESKLATASQAQAGDNHTLILEVWELRAGQPLVKPARCESQETAGIYNVIPIIFFAKGDQQVVLARYEGGGKQSAWVLDIAANKLGPKQLLEAGNFLMASGASAHPALNSGERPGEFRVGEMMDTRDFLLPLASVMQKRDYSEEPLITVSGKDLSPDGREVLILLKNQTVSLWDSGPHSIVPLRIALFRDPSLMQKAYAELSADGGRLLGIDPQHTARVWDTRTGHLVVDPLSDAGTVVRARLSPDGQAVVIVQTNNWMRIWQLSDGKPVSPAFRDGPAVAMNKERDGVSEMFFSSDGRRLAVTWARGAVQVWEVQRAQLLTEIPAASGPTLRAILSADGKRLATVGDERTVRIWDTSTGAGLTPPLKHDDLVTCCQFSPDATKLATGSRDKTARIWDLQTGRLMSPALNHEAQVDSVQFEPGGASLITASTDHAVRVWDVASGTLVRSIKPDQNLSAITLCQGGRLLFTMGYSGLRQWDMATGTPVSEPIDSTVYPGFTPQAFSVSADGGRVAVVLGSEARIWDMPRVGGAIPDWLPRLAEVLAGQSINEQGITAGVSPEEFLRLRQSVLAGKNDDIYGRWAKWFFAEDNSATISPVSSVTLSQHIKGCIESKNRLSLREALLLDPGNVNTLAAFLELANSEIDWSLDKATRFGGTEEQRREAIRMTANRDGGLADRVLETLPDNAAAWRVKAFSLYQRGQNEEALAALDHVSSATGRGDYHIARATIFEKLFRNDEAYQELTEAINVANAESPRATAGLYLARSRFLKRQNRVAEAGKDVCAALGIPLRDPSAPPKLIDLSSSYTTALTNVSPLGMGDSALSDLPIGVQTLGGTKFDIRGIIFGPRSYAHSSSITIPVNLRCRALHFLQGAAFAWQSGTRAGGYTIRYVDQHAQDIPLVIGKQVGDWSYYAPQPVAASEAPLVWVGTDDKLPQSGPGFMRLYKMTWVNPVPDVEIQTIDFGGGSSGQMPFLIALTAEPVGAEPSPEEPAGVPDEQAIMSQTMATLDAAIAAKPQEFSFVGGKVALLEAMNQTNQALSLVSTAITDAEAKGESATNTLIAALHLRSALLGGMNKIEEAQKDWLRASGVPEREPRAGTNLIDLSRYYNSSLAEGWVWGNRSGRSTGHYLDELPAGVREFAGVRFDVRGLIQLAGRPVTNPYWSPPPGEVKGISIGKKARRLSFLFGVGGRVTDGTKVGRYVVHYVGDHQQDVPIIYGQHVRDWRFDPNLSETTGQAVVAWTGENAASRTQGMALRLYKLAWENPFLDSVIESIDFVSEHSNASPFLVAITVEP